MLRRDPTTIKLAPEDVKEFYREQTYNTIAGSSNNNPLGGEGLDQNYSDQQTQQQSQHASGTSGQSIKERIIGSSDN